MPCRRGLDAAPRSGRRGSRVGSRAVGGGKAQAAARDARSCRASGGAGRETIKCGNWQGGFVKKTGREALDPSRRRRRIRRRCRPSRYARAAGCKVDVCRPAGRRQAEAVKCALGSRLQPFSENKVSALACVSARLFCFVLEFAFRVCFNLDGRLGTGERFALRI